MTMTPLLLTTTEDGTGKTAIALALAQLALERDRTVGYMKPKGTRLQSTLGKTFDRDPVFAAELLDLDVDIEVLEPIVYSSTFIQGILRGHDDPAALRETVRERYEHLAAEADFLAVEGGGHLETGAVIDLTDPQLAELLDARVVLVTRHRRLEEVDATLATAMRFGDRLEGVLFNAVEDGALDDLEADVVPFLRQRGVPTVGTLPRRRELAGVPAGQLAEELGAEVLVEAGLDGLVERFLIGAMGRDVAVGHFRRTRAAAVITGGDRADIQTAAIEAPGVRCLVLTGGHRPSQAVLGRAAAAGVPVILVGADTRSAVERAEGVVRSGRTRDAEAVAVMRELLTNHADVDRLLGDG
ncbi:MAG: AAA family ATPase [Halobacteriales archaeon]